MSLGAVYGRVELFHCVSGPVGSWITWCLGALASRCTRFWPLGRVHTPDAAMLADAGAPAVISLAPTFIRPLCDALTSLPLQLQLFPALTAPRAPPRRAVAPAPGCGRPAPRSTRGTSAASRARAAPSQPLPHPHRRPRSAPPSGPRAPTIYPSHPSRQAPGPARVSRALRGGQEFVPAPMRRHAKRALGMRVDRLLVQSAAQASIASEPGLGPSGVKLLPAQAARTRSRCASGLASTFHPCAQPSPSRAKACPSGVAS